jgi:crotonobetainyl-CoA:carnitine CoA-transferase CaiB-like acyl-CoA transferase
VKHWLDRLVPADYWCAEVLSWETLRKEEAYRALDWEQTVTLAGGSEMKTSRCPIRIDGEIYKSPQSAPRVGQHSDTIRKEFQQP